MRASASVVAHAGVAAAAPPAAAAGATTLRRAAFPAAADALELLGAGPLVPTGAVRDALAAGRLLRTGTPDRLDHAELVLRSGTIERDARQYVGNGMNGDFHRFPLRDPVDAGAPPLWAVEKPAGAQAAQEELGWRLARELGIDHLVPSVARRPDGAAWIEYRPGRALSMEGIDDVPRLEQALAKGYLEDPALALSRAEAAQAARIDRQLLQVLDYVGANNDRRTTNGLFDAARGGRLSFIDFGHAARGQLAHNNGSVLEPALMLFQAGSAGGRVELDPVVVEHVRRRLTPERIRAIHAAVFEAEGIAGPPARTYGERFIGLARSPQYREGMVTRLEHLLESRGYTHRPATGDNAGELPPMVEDRPIPVGFAATRAAFRMF